MPRSSRLAILNAGRQCARCHAGAAARSRSATHDLDPKTGKDYVALSISDTGTGMPADVVERAFEPFFTTKDVGKGTGLGLSQIYGFAAQAGGRAEIRSKEGEGTTISLVLPRTNKTLAGATQAASMSKLPQGLRVLLVEDNPQVRDFAEGLLADLGCEVVTADCAEAALERLADDGVDLVLSDVVMPGMSGVELAQKMQEDYPEVPILLATGYSDEIVKRGFEFSVLLKPFGAADLSKAMAATLNGACDAAA